MLFMGCDYKIPREAQYRGGLHLNGFLFRFLVSIAYILAYIVSIHTQNYMLLWSSSLY